MGPCFGHPVRRFCSGMRGCRGWALTRQCAAWPLASFEVYAMVLFPEQRGGEPKFKGPRFALDIAMRYGYLEMVILGSVLKLSQKVPSFVTGRGIPVSHGSAFLQWILWRGHTPEFIDEFLKRIIQRWFTRNGHAL